MLHSDPVTSPPHTYAHFYLPCPGDGRIDRGLRHHLEHSCNSTWLTYTNRDKLQSTEASLGLTHTSLAKEPATENRWVLSSTFLFTCQCLKSNSFPCCILSISWTLSSASHLFSKNRPAYRVFIIWNVPGLFSHRDGLWTMDWVVEKVWWKLNRGQCVWLRLRP